MTDTPIHHWTMDNISGSSVLDEISGGESLAFSGRTTGAGWDGNAMIGGDSSSRLLLAADTAFKAVHMRIRRLDLTKIANILQHAATGNSLSIQNSSASPANAIFTWTEAANNTNLTIADTTTWHSLWFVEAEDANHHWVYLDGVKASASVLTNFSGAFRCFGRGAGVSTQENVSVDNIQWYDRIPSDAEIAWLVAATTQTSTLPMPVTPFLRRLLLQSYALEGSPRAILAQDWNLMLSLRNVVNQDWSLRMLQILAQYYGDVPVVRQLLEQYWGPAAMLRRLVAQPYGDALRLRAGLDQEWGLNAGLLAMMEQRYSIAGDRYLAMAEQAYNINEYNILRAALDQVSIIAADSALVQRPVISVTADGAALDVSHVAIEIDEATLAISGEIHPADQAGFLRCRHLETVVTITIDADVYTLIVEAPRSSRPEVGQEQWIVPLASPTIKLDAPYALPLTREFAGAMASAIVTELAALEGITVVWSLLDWYLPAGTIYANAETPLAVIRKIVAAVGGVLQSSPAGDLICRPEYPLSPPAWASATPSHYLTDMDNFFSVDATPEIRDGWNRYLVADQDAAGELGLSLEAIDIDEHRKEVRVYQVPYNPAAVIALRTSGGSWVGIVAEGVTVETLTEQVEIVAGEGNVAKPLTTKISHDYRETVLGAITTAEDGHLRTEIDGNSLVEIVYTTTYRKFIVSDPNIEDVQFFPEEVAA